MTAWAYPIGSMLLLVVIWQVATIVLAIPDYLLPPPTAIAHAMIANEALLVKHSLTTTVEILLGFALSIVVGVPLALAISLEAFCQHDLSAADRFTSCTEGRGGAAVPGMVRLQPVAEGFDRLPYRVLPCCHQHGDGARGSRA